MDPIAVSETHGAKPDSPIVCAPLIYGYVSYAHGRVPAAPPGLCRHPGRGRAGPGRLGAGRHRHRRLGLLHGASEAAIDFAYWVAGAEVQRGPYAAAGRPARPCRRPGSDAAVNAATGDFYRDTRATLEGAWVRPRHDGYMAFQQEASDRINDGLQQGAQQPRASLSDLNRLFRRSFSAEYRHEAGNNRR